MRIKGLKNALIASALWLTAMTAHALTNSTNTANPEQTNTTTITPLKTDYSKFSGTWYLRLIGERNEDPMNQKSISRFFMGANLYYQALDELKFNVFPRFRHTSGYAQTKSSTDANSTGWYLRQASADLSLTSKYDLLSVGILDQGKNHHSILLDEISFPAAKMDIHTSSANKAQLGIVAEGAVPTSTSVTTESQNFEKTPGFQSYGAYFNYIDANNIEFKNRAVYFAFSDLPTSIATPAGLAGNTTESVGGTVTRFVYEYRGYQADSGLKWYATKNWALGVRGAWLRNTEAPNELNQGYWGRAYTEINLNKNIMIAPFYTYYRIEPDATVATYNDDTINTNRVGYRAGFNLELKRTVRFSIYGGERDAVYLSPSQLKERVWNIKLETMDAAI